MPQKSRKSLPPRVCAHVPDSRMQVPVLNKVFERPVHLAPEWRMDDRSQVRMTAGTVHKLRLNPGHNVENGLVAYTNIKKGEYIVKYTGRHISGTGQGLKNKSYVMVLEDRRKRTASIDGHPRHVESGIASSANYTPFVTANAMFFQESGEWDQGDNPVAYIIAKRDIPAGQEIRVDYDATPSSSTHLEDIIAKLTKQEPANVAKQLEGTVPKEGATATAENRLRSNAYLFLQYPLPSRVEMITSRLPARLTMGTKMRNGQYEKLVRKAASHRTWKETGTSAHQTHQDVKGNACSEGGARIVRQRVVSPGPQSRPRIGWRRIISSSSEGSSGERRPGGGRRRIVISSSPERSPGEHRPGGGRRVGKRAVKTVTREARQEVIRRRNQSANMSNNNNISTDDTHELVALALQAQLPKLAALIGPRRKRIARKGYATNGPQRKRRSA
jgi:hypothetical protein